MTKAQVLGYIKECLMQETQDAQKVDFVLWRLAKRHQNLGIEVSVTNSLIV